MNTSAPPPVLDQRAIIKDLFKKHGKLAAANTWYLISYKWFKNWKDNVEYEETGVTTTTQVDPIDNSDLLVPDTTKLKFGLLEDTDYALVPTEVWSMLHSWYVTTLRVCV
jgi:hypothetical protein